MIAKPKPIREIDEDMKTFMRGMFRIMVVSGFVKHNLGIEGAEEALENLYDNGHLKVTFEPGTGARFMLYDDKIRGYRMINGLNLSHNNGGK